MRGFSGKGVGVGVISSGLLLPSGSGSMPSVESSITFWPPGVVPPMVAVLLTVLVVVGLTRKLAETVSVAPGWMLWPGRRTLLAALPSQAGFALRLPSMATNPVGE